MVVTVGLIALGVFAGIASGLFGIGGGVIIVPALAFFFQMKQQTAVATSLMALLLPVGGLGIYNYYKNGFITSSEIKMGLWIALGIFVGAYLGSLFGSQMSSKNLSRAFSVFLIFVAVRIWLSAK